MKKHIVFWLGILGVVFFMVTIFLAGLQIDNYSSRTQLISELTTIEIPDGNLFRWYGYIPSGILLTCFSFLAIKQFPKSKLIKLGFIFFGIFYGIATIVVAVFPCDKGCNKYFINPSISQLIHTLTGLLTYIFVPIGLLLIGFGLQKFKKFMPFSIFTLVSGVLSFILIGAFISEPNNIYIGFQQRIIEGIFILWIIICAFQVKKINTNET